MLTHAEIRARLRAMSIEIESALRYTADGRYGDALECVAALADSGMSELAAGLAKLAEDNPGCACSGSCADCAPLDAGQWS